MFLRNMNFRLKISSKFMLCRNIQNSGHPFFKKIYNTYQCSGMYFVRRHEFQLFFFQKLAQRELSFVNFSFNFLQRKLDIFPPLKKWNLGRRIQKQIFQTADRKLVKSILCIQKKKNLFGTHVHRQKYKTISRN